MKIKNQISLVLLFFILTSFYCYSQAEIIEKEKLEETARIKTEIEQFREKYIPIVKELLIKSPKGLTQAYLDSLIIDLVPTFIIKPESSVKLYGMIRVDSLMEGYYFSLETDSFFIARGYKIDTSYSSISNFKGSIYIYDFYLAPAKDKKTIYSAISFCEDFEISDRTWINIYSINGIIKYNANIPYPYDSNSFYVVKESDPRLKRFEKNKLTRYTNKGLRFHINLDSTTLNDYVYNSPQLRSPSAYEFKDRNLVLYNNRIYSELCLVRTFKTTDLDWIFENHPNDLCNCDIDVFFRKNITLEEYKKKMGIIK